MLLTKLYINGYKNLKNVNITLDDKLNVFYGENAQGKTNIIEAIWLMTGAKSFRNTKEKDFICIGENTLNISVLFKNSFREQNIEFSMYRENLKDKKILLNGVKVKTLSELFGNLKCVVFTPEDVSISKGSPEIRRNFIDLCISQIRPSYKGVISKYENLIMQRNAVLKNIALGKNSTSDLEIWDEQIARLGAYISVLRYNYTQKLNVFATKLYKSLSHGKENIEISYTSTIYSNLLGKTDFKGEMYEEYIDVLKQNINNDTKFGFTSIGIHRDDIITKINGLPTRDFGSQGQQRSIALVLKLAQAYILLEETDQAPVLLLDDVLSELDEKRQKFVLSSIKNMQVIITCCNSDSINIDKGNVFTVKNGRVIKAKIGGKNVSSHR